MAADQAWTAYFMCIFDIHAKNSLSTKKVVLQKACLGYKKVKFVLEVDEVSVYNQLTSSTSGRSQPEELTSGYSQLQNCTGFELMKCIPNCKVLEPLECQGKIYIRPIQRSLSVLPLKSKVSTNFNFRTKGKNKYIVIRNTLSMSYTPMCFHAYLPIICYQMTVMKTVTFLVTIAVLKFLLAQKMDSTVIISNYRVKMKTFIPMKVLLLERSNKIL